MGIPPGFTKKNPTEIQKIISFFPRKNRATPSHHPRIYMDLSYFPITFPHCVRFPVPREAALVAGRFVQVGAQQGAEEVRDRLEETPAGKWWFHGKYRKNPLENGENHRKDVGKWKKWWKMVIEPPKIWWFHNDPRKRWGFPWGFLIKVGFSKIFRTISLGHLTGSCRFKEFRIRMVFNNQRCGFETLIAECSKPQFYYFKNQVFNHET